MRTVWTANFEGNEIQIENTWFHGERLIVNSQLQDEKISMLTSDLTGYVTGANGQRLDIKVNISGNFTMSCRLFVDHQKVEVTKVK